MKSYKILLAIMCSLCCSLVSAQTTYKNVTVDRDRSDVKSFNIINGNNCPVDVRVQYKVGSREAEWKSYFVDGQIGANETRLCPVGSKIYALKITYVHVDCRDQIREGIDAFVSGWNEGKKQNANGQ